MTLRWTVDVVIAEEDLVNRGRTTSMNGQASRCRHCCLSRMTEVDGLLSQRIHLSEYPQRHLGVTDVSYEKFVMKRTASLTYLYCSSAVTFSRVTCKGRRNEGVKGCYNFDMSLASAAYANWWAFWKGERWSAVNVCFEKIYFNRFPIFLTKHARIISSSQLKNNFYRF